MDEPELIPAKAILPGEQSDSIIVSFGSEWHPHVLAQNFSLVIRKRIPKSSEFKWLYFHINAPVGAICGRANIRRIFLATEKEVLPLAKCIGLDAKDIRGYFAGDERIGCYELDGFQFSSRPLTTGKLSSYLVYHPPQSFVIVSKQAKSVIDQMGGFPKGKSQKPKKRKYELNN